MAYLLLALAPLLWAGNWIVGRALHETTTALGLNLGRWTVALVILAAMTAPRWRTLWPAILAHWRSLLTLAAAGGATFHVLVYAGLQHTTAINGVLLNSTTPVFVVLASRLMLGETVTRRQAAGMAISFAGILAIVSRGRPEVLLESQMSAGDVLLLIAMPFWALYSVLLRRTPGRLAGVDLVTGISFFTVLLLVPAVLVETAVFGPRMRLDLPALAAILYIGAFASVAAYYCWNRGVAQLGPNRAGIFLHLLPAYGAGLAVLFLGESVSWYHGAGIALILAGVSLASAAPRSALAAAPETEAR